LTRLLPFVPSFSPSLLCADDIKAMSDLIVTRVNKEKFTLDIVGTVAAVRSARFMLPTQVCSTVQCACAYIQNVLV
jgi:hypothetical protein